MDVLAVVRDRYSLSCAWAQVAVLSTDCLYILIIIMLYIVRSKVVMPSITDYHACS